MNVVGSSYVPVKANTVMPMAEGGSGPDAGWEMEGSYVNWDSENGVTGKDWQGLIDAPNSPFMGMSEESIQNHINSFHNLNSFFKELSTYAPSARRAFYNHLETYYGFTDGGGCIGDRIY